MTRTVTEPRRDPAYDTPADELDSLRRRVADLERERDHLLAVVDILHTISAAPPFSEILQTVASTLGETFGLDRCSIFLTRDAHDVRLVASYEDPTLRNLVVDLNRYPELERALRSGETVVIPDAVADPPLTAARPALELRNVRSIVVVPIRWQGTTIGAILIRTEREGSSFSDGDIRFCQGVAALTANALSAAHRSQTRLRGAHEPHPPHPAA
jgi:two-component system sensor histidine kinase ChiS